MTDVVVKLTITGDGTVAVKAVNDVASASERATGRVKRDSAEMAQAWGTSAKAASSLSSDAQRAAGAMAGAFVAVKAAGGAKALLGDLIGMADGWSQISARVRLATDDHEQAADVIDRLYDSSQRTGTQLDSSVTLYTRLAQSTSDLGLSQQRLLPLAEAINQTFAVSGTGAQAASNAIIQLTQAFAGGVLRAEEYNSVIENSPRLAKALADGLGISVGQLRKQVNDGEVTVERMVRALESQVSTIQAEFDQLPMTVGRAWTMLGNSVLRYVGMADQGSGASLVVANAMLEVAENIDLVLIAIGGLGAAHLANAAKALIQDQAQRRVAASALAEAEAQVVKLRAQAPLLGSTTALAAAELQLAKAQEAATAAGVGKITMLGRLGNGLLTLAGGPVGIAVLAIAGLGAAIKAVSDAEDERQRVFKAGVEDIGKLTARISELNDQIERWRQGHGELPDFGATYATWAQGADELARAQEELNAKRAAIEGIEARIQAAQQSTNEAAGIQLLSLLPKLQKLQDEYRLLESVVTALGAAQGKLDVEVFVDPGQASVASDQAVQAFARLTAAAKTAEAQIDKAKQGQIAYWRELGNTRVAQARAAGATADQVAAIEKENAALLKTIDAGIKANSTKASGAKASNDAAKAARDFVADLQKQVATYGQNDAAAARYELGTKKVTAAQRQQALALIAQLEEWDKMSTIVDKAADAWAEFLSGNRQLDEQLAQGRDRLAGLSDAQIDYNASVREANRLAVEALALGPPTLEQSKLLEDRLRKLAELRDQQLELDAHTAAVERNRAAAEAWTSAWDQATGDVATVLADFVTGQIKSFDDLGDALVDIVRRYVADMIAEYLKLQIINPFINSLLGTNMQTGGGVLQGIMSLFGGASGAAGGSSGGVLGGIAQAFGGGGGLFSAGNWIKAGQSIWSGFFGGASAAGGLAGITSAATGMYGAGTAVTGLGSFGYAGAAPWMTSTGMVGLGGAGYTGASAGAASTGAMTSSMAVPIIGWIVAAVMANMSLYSQGWRGDFGSMDLGHRNAALNGATGGGAWASAAAGELFRGIGLGGELSNLLSGEALWGTLFGRRKPRVTGYSQDFLFGPDGADATAAVNWRAKGGLFSSDRRGSESIDVDAGILREIEQFWQSVTRSMSSVARRFGAEAPEAISASFREEYNKKGELVRSIGTLMGVQYEEAWEVFQQRVLGENLIAALSATTIGAEASDIAERWRGDAAALLDGAHLMVLASDDIRRGAGLLGAKSGLGDVVDLVESLALAGESLVDAYARITESTRLYETALQLTGNAFDGTREALVRFAVDIAEAAGGLEAAQSLWASFFANYYDANTTAVMQLDALWTSARQQLGDLGLPSDIDMSGFRSAFEAALPKLTPDQIVTWLQAADALAQATASQAAYTAALVEGSLNYIGIVSQLETELGRSSGYAGNLAQIRLWEQSTTRALNDAARAAGRMGASERDLAMVREVAEQRVQQLIAQLRASVASLRDQLYGGSATAVGAWGDAVVGQVDAIGRATDDLYRRQLAGIQSVRDYLDQMLLGDLSGLTPQGQLDEAWRQLLEMQQAALAGDADAMAALPQMADTFLRLLRAFTASGSDYEHGVNGVGGFWDVRALLEAVAAMSPTVPAPSELGGSAATGTPVTNESFNEALAINREALAQQLVGYIADLAAAVQRPVFDLLDEMDINLRALVSDLGIDLRNITAESVRGLAQLAATFGISLTELTAELGLQLTALGDGVRELATQMGIDLTAMTVASTQSLADLARQLGVDLGELATSVGISLGDLADRDSLLNQALEAAIASLPADQRDQLAPLLADISNATTRADANAAIAALEAAVLLLPPDLRDVLAPYLAGVDPSTALSQLDYLDTLNTTATAQLDRLDQQVRLLDRVNSNLAAVNAFQGLPSYAVGTGYVMGDQVAQIHHAEAVVPAHVNAWLRSAGWQLPSFSGDTRAIESWLSRIAASCERIADRVDEAAETISRTVEQSNDEAARRVEVAVELAVENGPRGRD